MLLIHYILDFLLQYICLLRYYSYISYYSAQIFKFYFDFVGVAVLFQQEAV